MARLSLIVDPSGAEQGYRRAGQAADKFKSQASGSVRATNSITGAFDRLTRSVFSLRGLLAGAGAGLITRHVIKAFSDFERQLIEVGKTTDLQGEQLEALGERIQGIAQRVPVATGRLQSLAVAAGQLGVTGVENVAAFTETLGKLETATDIAGEQGARSLARLLNITGESNDKISNLGSSITALGNQFATTEEEISRTSTFLASATGQFGVSAQEVLGLSAALRALGQRAETSGSSVGAALGSINTAVAESGDQLQMLASLTGMTMDQFTRRFQEDATGALLDFADALGDVPAAEQTQILDELGLAGRETSRVINALASDTDMVRDAVSVANDEWERNEALNIEAARAAESFSAQMQFLSNALNEAAVDIGRELAPVILDLTRDFRDWIQVASETGQISRTFEDVADAAQFMAENLDKAVVAGGALVGLRIGAVFGPWGALIGAAAGALGSFALASDDTTEATRSYNEAMEANARLQQAMQSGSDKLVEQRKAEAAAAREAAIAENELLLSRRESMQEGLSLSDPGLPRGFAETFADMAQSEQQAFLASENITDQTKQTLREYVRVGDQIDDTRDKLRELRGTQVMLNVNMDEAQTLGVGLSTSFAQVAQEAEKAAQATGRIDTSVNMTDVRNNVGLEAGLYGTQEGNQRREQELQAEREAQEQKLQEVEEYLQTREEREQSAYERRREIINESVDDEQRRQGLLESLEAKHLQNMRELQADSLSAEEIMWEESWAGRAQVVGGILSNLSTLMQSTSREMFEVGKAAAIAETITNTYSSATKAYNSLAGIPYVGPALGAAAAAAAIAAGLANVQRIQSTEFGGGSAGGGNPYSSVSSVGPGSTGPQAFTQQPQSNDGEGGGGITFIFNGPIQGNDAKKLIAELRKELDEGDAVLVSSSSRNGRELQGRAA